MEKNSDDRVVAGFGDEWSRFDQSSLTADELKNLFNGYFSIFPWTILPESAQGFDMGCGSGRWATLVAPMVGRLSAVDPSPDALDVARKNLSRFPNVTFINAGVHEDFLPDNSQDFGYSLGVLHHIPDTQEGINACVRKLKVGAPFLIYLYYRFDNRPAWFRALWKATDIFRYAISRLPHALRYAVSQVIALVVYFPLARLSWLVQFMGLDPSSLPLSHYRDKSFYTMRTDALDRFGTRLEQRFTRNEIERMLKAAGLQNIVFSEGEPYWCAMGIKI